MTGKFLALEPLEMGDLVASMATVVGVVVPNDILCFKLTIIDGTCGEKEVDNNNNTMQEEAIKAVLVWEGTELCTVGFLSRSIVVVEKDMAR
jgi:hypothetical protein